MAKIKENIYQLSHYKKGEYFTTFSFRVTNLNLFYENRALFYENRVIKVSLDICVRSRI